MGGGILIFCCKKMCSMLITFFFFCWFIAGNVCIFTIYKPDFEMRGDNYCDKTLYLFAFGSTIFTYVLIGVMCVAWYHEEEDQGHNTPVSVLAFSVDGGDKEENLCLCFRWNRSGLTSVCYGSRTAADTLHRL
ncbi:uncharacterized protein ABDE67_020147 [Symphorus nematophorus]